MGFPKPHMATLVLAVLIGLVVLFLYHHTAGKG